MAYWFTAWNGLTVPTALGDRGSMDIAAGQADAPLIQLPGGRVFDPLGSDDAYVPSTQYTARVLIVSNTPSTIKTVLDTWQAKRGKVGALTRTPDDGSTAQTIQARLIRADVNRTLMGSRIVPLTLVFQAISLPWSGTAYSAVALTKATVSGTNYVPALTVAGNTTQRIAQLTITPAAATTMSNFKFQVVTSVIAPIDTTRYFTYAASVAATKVLYVDTAKRIVTNDGTASYANATPPTTMEAWIEIPSTTPFLLYSATFAGGTGVNVSITYYDAWA